MKAFPVILSLVIAAYAADPDNECPPEQEWDWTIEKLLRHPDCDKFYKCAYGKPVEQNCPSGLWFCLDNMRCEWPHLVDCEDRHIPGQTTTPAPNTTTSITTQTPNITTTTDTLAPNITTTTTTLIPNITTTSTTVAPNITTTTTTLAPNITTTTTTVAPNISTTPTTLVPNITTTSTTVASNITTTTTTIAPNITTTTTTPNTTDITTSPVQNITTTTQAPTTTPEIRPNECPADPHVHLLLPHETDCNLFYYCVWGEKVLRQCPGVLHFNRELQVCDWPQNAGCVASLNKHLESRLEIAARR